MIHNADGGEVEHCGNGARCFVRYVVDRGLTDKRRIAVKTVNNLLHLELLADGRVTVDMGAPRFGHTDIPFDPAALPAAARQEAQGWQQWGIPLEGRTWPASARQGPSLPRALAQ